MEYLFALEQKYKNIAYFYAAIGYIAQGFMFIVFKVVCQVISPFHALMMRAFTLLLINLVLLRSSKQEPYIKNSKLFKAMLKRLVFSTSYGVITNYCLKYLPASTVTSLSNTSPIFIFFIEAIYYKKSLNKISLVLATISFVGVLCIIQPQFIFKNFNNAADQESNSFIYKLREGFVILAAFCFSMTMLYIHDIGRKVGSFVNLQYSYMGHIFFSAIMCNLSPPQINYDKFNIKFIFTFLLMASLALITQYMIFTSTSLKKPSYTMPLGYLTIVTTFLADIIFFQTSFGVWQISGMILTSVGLFGKLLLGQQVKRKSENVNLTAEERQRLRQQDELDEVRSREEQFEKI